MSDCDFTEEAAALLSLIESDFGQSGRSVQYEAIRVELEYAYRRGLRAQAIATARGVLEWICNEQLENP